MWTHTNELPDHNGPSDMHSAFQASRHVATHSSRNLQHAHPGPSQAHLLWRLPRLVIFIRRTLLIWPQSELHESLHTHPLLP
jgi:hypothetical protein